MSAEREQQTAETITGKPLNRVDGRLKVTGGAKYAGEFSAPNLAHASLIQSTIAKGRIKSIDTAEAERAPGVLAVITATSAPTVAKPPKTPFFLQEISFSGQNIGVVVAESLEQAERAAELVKVEYEEATPDVTIDKRFDQAVVGGRGGGAKRGDFDAGLAASTTKVDQMYYTPVEHHNPMEPHATVAIWDGENLRAYDATQGVSGSKSTLANAFGIDPKNVRVVDPFVGGGFGCKGRTWPHTPIAAYVAQVVKRPVRLALTRRQMFTSNGHRTETFQAMVLGAGSEGKLLAIKHDMHGHVSENDEFMESTGGPAGLIYSCPNVEISQKIVRANVPPPTYMRAPGWSSGSFGNETAIDELAWALNIDPLEMRLRNYADKDESSNRPWSSKHLKECYEQAAQVFGWSKRNPSVASMKQGRMLVGYGMATASYPAHYSGSSAKARILANGNAVIQCGTQDLGTGTYTILTQIAADALGLSPAKVRVEIADTDLPPAPGSGGSTSATSAGSAVMEAAQGLKTALLNLATADAGSPLHGHSAEDLIVQDGRVFPKQAAGLHLASANTPGTMTYAEIMAKSGKTYLDSDVTLKPSNTRMAGSGNTSQGFGAQFCEVHVDPDLRTIRVARWVGAFALGKVLNAKTLQSQLSGGIVWGIGMGLLEETVPDIKYGRFLNTNLAEYHVPVNKDVPPIEIILVPEVDTIVSPLGAKGAGEIGITGAAAAIGNAVYHATGKRVRDLPITLDKIM